jgi:GH25 family lysozyme M1 (1,4-beta-N-acetylmuramidase)
MSKLGIDVSDNQGYIDWPKVKAVGVEFAILRTVRRSGNIDKQLASNIKGCKEFDIPFEFYKYTYADTVAEARAEAKAVVDALDKLGVEKGCRVWYDLEEDSIINKGKSHIDELYTAFKDELAKGGFKCGLYMGMYDYNNYVDKHFYDGESKWIARYYNGYTEMKFGETPNEKYVPASDCDGWQFTSSGVVSGIKGTCDMNIFYGEIVVPSIAPEYYQTPEFTLIDSLNKIGVDSSYKFRKKIAKANGISDYAGTAEQNTKMLELLNDGKLLEA